ncbi:MAG: site-specific integrase [Bacteroidetes bacterium]|nr:site-specific integrase [Bacteroidota bacterium]
MTHQQALRKLQTDMQLRGFSTNTIESYSLPTVRFLSQCRKTDVRLLDEKDFRTHLLYLYNQEVLKPASINQYNSAIRFFYEVTLEKDINYKRVPHSKKHKTRPEVLSVSELISFFDEINNPKHFAFYLNLYGSGLRISEMVSLQTRDIDGKRMLLHVRNGKGGKERFAPLTDAGYTALQYYWKMYRPVNVHNYIFPDCTKTRTLTTKAFSSQFKKLYQRMQDYARPPHHKYRHYNYADVC